MKIQGLKNLNITLLFSAPLNHLLISQADVIKLFTTGNPQKDLFNFVEAPGLKVAIFPNQKKDIAFESLHIRLNDKNEIEVDKSTLIDDFRKVLNSGFIDKSKIIAYGFNYDFLVELENGNDLIGAKISKIPNINIKSVGVNISFEKDGLTHMLTMTPTGQGKIFIASFNSHFNSNDIPADEILKTQLQEQVSKFKEITKSL